MPFFCNEGSLHYLVRGTGEPLVTNASLLALLTDQPPPTRVQTLSLSGSIAEEHALGA